MNMYAEGFQQLNGKNKGREKQKENGNNIEIWHEDENTRME